MIIANLFNAVIPINCRTTNPLSPLNVRIKPNTYYLLAEMSPKNDNNVPVKLLLMTRDVVPRDSFNAICRPELYRFEKRDDNNIQYKLKQIHIADSNSGLLLSIGNFDNLLIYKSYLNNNKQRCRTAQHLLTKQPHYNDYFQNPNLRSNDNNDKLLSIVLKIVTSIIMLLISLLVTLLIIDVYRKAKKYTR